MGKTSLRNYEQVSEALLKQYPGLRDYCGDVVSLNGLASFFETEMHLSLGKAYERAKSELRSTNGRIILSKIPLFSNWRKVK